LSHSPTANAPQTAAPAQLDDRDLDQVSGGLLPAVAPQSIVSPRDPASATGPKLGIPLI
jgi:hypothetical protein